MILRACVRACVSVGGRGGDSAVLCFDKIIHCQWGRHFRLLPLRNWSALCGGNGALQWKPRGHTIAMHARCHINKVTFLCFFRRPWYISHHDSVDICSTHSFFFRREVTALQGTQLNSVGGKRWDREGSGQPLGGNGGKGKRWEGRGGEGRRRQPVGVG